MSAAARTLGPLTARQQEILKFVEEYFERHGCAPTMREIGAACGAVQVNAVAWHLERLEERGLIARDPSVPRGLRLTSLGELTQDEKFLVKALAKLPPGRLSIVTTLARKARLTPRPT